MLELKNISKTFFPGTIHEKTALDNLSLTLQEGDFVTVMMRSPVSSKVLEKISSSLME